MATQRRAARAGKRPAAKTKPAAKRKPAAKTKPAARKFALHRGAPEGREQAQFAAKKPAGREQAQFAAQRPGAAASPRPIRITVNGRPYDFEVGRDIAPETTLATLLRDKLGFTGLKVACDEGACGGCTVLLDGRAVLSCMMLAVEAHGHDVLTIEGLAKDDPVIEAFAVQSEPGYGTALQCGFCTPGFVMSATALLRANPSPAFEEIKEGLSGNICRCGCYAGIAQAVQHAAEAIARGGGR